MQRSSWRTATLVLLGALLALLPGGGLVQAADAQLARPEQALVTSPGAAVRSGPGDSFYLTDTLPEATEVEIYRKQSDGWCAIRPPANSFSWVFAQHLRIVDDRRAEVSKDDVAARVGSRLSSQRDVIQVRMHKGESVAIVGRDERDGGAWYKIAPPAGEFRWVHASDLGLGAPPAAAARAVKQAALEQDTPDTAQQLTAPPLADDRYGPRPNRLPPKPADNWTTAKTSPPPYAATTAIPTSPITPIGADKSAATSRENAAIPPGQLAAGELAEHLQVLELRLSRMVAEPPATWNIAPLEQAAEQLLARADTVADREAVKITLNKIDRFSAIQRRYVNSGGTVARAGTNAAATPSTVPVTGVGSMTAGDADSNAAGQPYDAVGILRPVVSRRPGAPQFALVNAQGQVVTFVTPTPDVNLQPYVGQRIAVTGNRGYIPEFRRAHVTAGRIVPMNDKLLR